MTEEKDHKILLNFKFIWMCKPREKNQNPHELLNRQGPVAIKKCQCKLGQKIVSGWTFPQRKPKQTSTKGSQTCSIMYENVTPWENWSLIWK